ncbi:hypothetical protein PHYSODRAFT_314872 [Phytophthora sojae]|uniref:RxLR effector protein n=1 Tax=Phytophthora sojae (strain P6497) TaxID=1094619 RepID=G4ZGT6_PHYSP|nr:hypothetical protein PHYSODRAFT_314872 [Phytophthora sojae]EGZ17585.1 hypothetical protein PHYSODRAFT_314872 [Phytophthora sojae]|eukprot:XP_009526643.1 hypothetical protein PHYSODRAFT_314872 [Phytophthora sojae]
MKIAAIAAALACFASFVTAADEHAIMDVGMTSDQAMAPGLRGTSVVVPAGVITNSIDAKNNNVFVTKSNIVLSKSDRVQLAKVIKETLATHPEADPAAANLILEQLEPDNDNNNRGTAGNVATNPAVVSNVVSSILSAMTRNPAAATGHAVGAIAAAAPVIMAPTTGSTPVNYPTRYIPPMTGTTTPYNAAGIGGLPAGISAPASPNMGAYSPSMTGGIGGLPAGIGAPASPSS